MKVFFCDGEAGAQCYIAAGEREQAGMLFRQVKGMVLQEPELQRRCQIYGGNAAAGQSRSIVREEDGSFLRVISADADSKHGGNTHLAIIDELHVQPTRDLVDVLRTSMASQNRAQPLLLYLTTADYQRESICNEIYEYACKVRDSVIEDASFLPVIYESGREEDWTSEDVWRKANPNLGVSVSLEYLQRECAKAKEIPAYENTFKRLHLNIITEQDTRAMPMDAWDACGEQAITDDMLAGRECYGGLDLASTTDVAAFVLVFPPDHEGDLWRIRSTFFIPSDNAFQRSRRDRVPYDVWLRQGKMIQTPGDVIDYDFIRTEISRQREIFDIKQIAVDRWNATHLVNQLQGDGCDCVAFGQGFSSMTAPTKELLTLVAAKRISHGNHPVLRWMASNLATETDAAGNLKPSKKRSTEKIDGIVALIMAIGLAMVREPKGVIEDIVWA